MGISESVVAPAGTLGLCKVLFWLPLIASRNTPFLPSSARQSYTHCCTLAYMITKFHRTTPVDMSQRYPRSLSLLRSSAVFTRIKMTDATVSEVDNVSYIKLPGTKNASVWNYSAFKSKDGKTIWNEGRDKPNAYCHIAKCSKPALQYYGNTTNMVRYLQMLHPKYVITTTTVTPLMSFLQKKLLSLTDQCAKNNQMSDAECNH